jgi:hypothetical protein
LARRDALKIQFQQVDIFFFFQQRDTWQL